MEYLRKMLNRAGALFKAMPPSQRYSIAALFASVVVSLVMLVTWNARESYSPVLSELTGPQMTAIQDALKGTDYDYRFRDGTLFVAGTQRDTVLMDLTEKGALPSDISASFGFEDLVEPQGFNMKTAEQQQMEYNIALGNMLARAISTAPEIARAQVTINSSRDGYFGPFHSSAAVNITPRGSGKIPERKLDAICRLVAAAAGPQLPPEEVVVANMVTGEAYSIDDGESGFSRASSRLELQKTVNQYYSEAVERFFEPVLGRVQILVNVKVDARSTETREVAYDWTHRTSSETSQTETEPSAGNTLVQPNVGTSLAGGATAGSRSETSEKEEERAPSKEVLTDIPPGEVIDVQISVLADLARVEEIIREKDGLEADAAITPERLQTEYAYYEDILKKGLPFKGDDGGNISLVSFRAEPFAKFPVMTAAVGDARAPGRLLETFLSNWQAIALVLLAVAALFMMKSLAAKRPLDEDELASLAQQESDEESLLPEVEVDIEERRSRQIRESIEEMVGRDPQAALGLIKRWITRES